MSITDSINQARQRGASDDVIIQKIIQDNPDKKANFETAIQRGAKATQIIDEVLKQNQGLIQPIQPEQPKTGIAQSALDVAKGLGKEIAGQGIGLVRGVGSLTTGALASLNPKKTWKEMTAERQQGVIGTPFEGLVSGTPEAQRQDEILKATNVAQKVGKVVGFATSLLGGGVSKTITGAEKALSRSLERETLRLSGTGIREVGEKKIAEVSETLSKLKIFGSSQSRFDKISQATNEFEDIFQIAIKNSSLSAKKSKIVSQLDELSKSLSSKDPAETFSIRREIAEAKKILNEYSEDIPITLLNTFKRSFSERAYKTQWNKLSDVTQLGISRIFRQEVENLANKSGLKIGGLNVNDFNIAYGKVLTARGLLKAALGKPELGVLPRIIAYTTGTSLGYSAGGVAGGIVGATIAPKIAKAIFGTAPKSAASVALRTAAESGEKVRKALSKLIPFGK